jgi:hypothetical protein
MAISVCYGISMGDCELKDFCYLWDGTQKWTLVSAYYDEFNLEIEFSHEQPNIQELFALRKLCEEYRHIPIEQLRKFINDKTLDLGTMSGVEAQELEKEANELGLNTIKNGVSYSYEIPYNETDGKTLIIEDSNLRELIVEKMKAHGIKVTIAQLD